MQNGKKKEMEIQLLSIESADIVIRKNNSIAAIVDAKYMRLFKAD